jgi:glycosyltransferase involved in cell wall biosynthesis
MTFKKNDIWVFGFAFGHHGKYSAFHRILDYLPEEIRKFNVSFPWEHFLPRPLKSRLRREILRKAEKRMIQESSRIKPRLIHFLYPENCFLSGCFQRSFNGKVVLTLHQPESVLSSFRTSPQGLSFIETAQRADRLIAMSPHVVECYQKFFENQSVRVIPHGVDTNYFTPGNDISDSPLILTLGNWRRDFKIWQDVANDFLKRGRPETFCLVTNPENRKQFGLKKTANTLFMNGISDLELRELYNRSKALFLPLLDAVANNALLEGLSMGKQILVSDLPASRFYGADHVSYLDKDAKIEKASNALCQLLDQSSPQASRLGIRKYAESSFSWTHIAKTYLEEYSSLLSRE